VYFYSIPDGAATFFSSDNSNSHINGKNQYFIADIVRIYNPLKEEYKELETVVKTASLFCNLFEGHAYLCPLITSALITKMINLGWEYSSVVEP
jgi:hypothetical protein